MGVWGPDNFENDGANDYLVKLLDTLVNEIQQNIAFSDTVAFLQRYGEYIIIPAIDIYLTLSETYDSPPRFYKATALEWRKKYLDAYDVSTAAYQGDFKLERRKAIEETFDRLDKFLDAWPE